MMEILNDRQCFFINVSYNEIKTIIETECQSKIPLMVKPGFRYAKGRPAKLFISYNSLNDL